MLSAVILSLSCSIAFASPVQAGNADMCRAKTNKEIAREQRLYRAYLFGKREAENAPVGDVRYDKSGWAWLKGPDASTPWINSHPDNQGLRWSNTVMDQQDEHADALPIKGIFETKRVYTSELIPYLLQSIRALECRTAALCEIESASERMPGDASQPISRVQPIGCIAFTDLHTWPECQYGDRSDASIADQSDTESYCTEIAAQMVRREEELLKLVVEYDAGYRTLLQFAGNFDIFLRELRWPLTGTVRQSVQLLGQLARIPCFVSSCDSAPAAK